MVRFLQIEPTTRCNFTCGFCTGRYMDQSDLSFETFRKVLEDLPEVTHLELQGEGEPLLHKGFFEMARMAHERGIRVSTITNGSLLTESNVGRILDVGIHSLNVSIESPDPAQFSEIRGGRLDKVTAGIERLLAERDARGLATPTVGFAVTILKNTVVELPRIAELHDRLGMDGGIAYQKLNRMDVYTAIYDDQLSAQFMDNEAEKKLRQVLDANPRIEELIGLTMGAGHFYEELGKRGGRSHNCPWLGNALSITRNGDVMPCCMVKDTARYSFGTVGETSLAHILEARAGMDQRLARGDTPRQCAGCGYLEAGGSSQRDRFSVPGRWTRALARGTLRQILPGSAFTG